MYHYLARMSLVILVGLFSSFVSAEKKTESGIVLSSGVEGGGYWNAGMRLQRVAKDMDITIENLPSSGSVENLTKLIADDNPVNLVFAQTDAVQHYLNENPSAQMKLETLENIGQECVFIITHADSDLSTDEDLHEAQKLRVAIPSATSGVAVTLEYMASQISELENLEISYGDTEVAMKAIGTPEATVDAVMLIHRPKERSPEVDAALTDTDRYQLVALSNKHLTQKLWNGRNIYRSMTLPLPGLTEPLATVCVRGLLLANRQKLTLSQRNRLSDLVSYNWMRVYATQ